jgi:hypothetical protein
MARRDLEKMNLDIGRVRSRTDFLESYANTAGRELEDLPEPDTSPASPVGITRQPDIQWMLTMETASALREAASWAVYFDVDRAIALLTRAGFLYHNVDMAFGSFLLTVADTPPLDELSSDIELLARVNGLTSSRGSVAIPDSLHHPQQQTYLLLACAGMADKIVDYRHPQSIEDVSAYRQTLHAIAAESPIRQGVLPFGSLGIPIRVAWDIGVHLLQGYVSESADPDDSESLATVARYMTVLCRRYAETMELATVNDYLWNNAAAPVDVGDIEVIGIAALAAIHFGSEEITASVTRLGMRPDDISFIPFRLGTEIAERSPSRPQRRPVARESGVPAMSSWKVAVTDQSTAGVPHATLEQIAAALQQQVDNDFAPAWGVRADISTLVVGDVIPQGTWPLKIVDAMPGAGGVHLDDQGQPYAEAVNGPQLSIAISHELLEMLVNPWGNRFTPATAIDPNAPGRQVFYLVEVGDPCEVFSYDIGGVQVSDFILPAFYDPNAARPVDFLDTLAGPLPQQVPPGCYISWIDPTDGKWHQQTADGTLVTAAATPGRNPRDDRDAAFGDAAADRHNIPAIYRAWARS